MIKFFMSGRTFQSVQHNVLYNFTSHFVENKTMCEKLDAHVLTCSQMPPDAPCCLISQFAGCFKTY